MEESLMKGLNTEMGLGIGEWTSEGQRSTQQLITAGSISTSRPEVPPGGNLMPELAQENGEVDVGTLDPSWRGTGQGNNT